MPELTSGASALAAIDNFQLTEALVDTGAGTLGGPGAMINGATLGDAQKSKIATGTETIASDGANIGITAKDFESFRTAVHTANLALQAKIDEILMVSTQPSC